MQLLILLHVLLLSLHLSTDALASSIDAPTDPAIHRLQSYLQIRSDHPEPDYAAIVSYLQSVQRQLLPHASFAAHTFVPDKPVVIITVPGLSPHLPSLVLNSHTDVVPTEPHKWSHPPFDARLVRRDDQWRVYARGAQDMKSVGMQYLEAMAALVARGWHPDRDVHLTFVPDEEIGGATGMGHLVNSTVFERMNVAVALDEGLPSHDDHYNVYYGERQNWWLAATVRGAPGHGANLPHSSAAQVLHSIVSRAFQFRERQVQKLEQGVAVGDLVGVNLVYMKGGSEDEHSKSGFTMNIIPSVVEAGFDIRIPPTFSLQEMDAEIESWFTCDGVRCPGASYDFVIKVAAPSLTSRDPKINPFMHPFMRALQRSGIADRLRHGIFHAASDSRYLRQRDIPCFGFSPIADTPNLLHKHDEYISVMGYLRGVETYQHIISELAQENVAEPTFEDVDHDSACESNL